MRVLVTGGSGFIGFHTVKRLLDEGHFVRILDSKKLTKVMYDPVKGVVPEFMLGDVRNLDVCRKGCEGIDAVVHHAAIASISRTIENPLEASEINIKGTRNLLQG
ncbi:MAG: NAD-dependent epimerase/dehydratase family protein, partial [Candidatus Omnitrophota bacterium]